MPGLLPHDLEDWSQALGLPTGIGLRVVREFVKICDYARLVCAMSDDRVKKFHPDYTPFSLEKRSSDRECSNLVRTVQV